MWYKDIKSKVFHKPSPHYKVSYWPFFCVSQMTVAYHSPLQHGSNKTSQMETNLVSVPLRILACFYSCSCPINTPAFNCLGDMGWLAMNEILFLQGQHRLSSASWQHCELLLLHYHGLAFQKIIPMLKGVTVSPSLLWSPTTLNTYWSVAWPV